MPTNAHSAAVSPVLDRRVVRTRNDVLQAAIRVLIDEGWDSVTHQHVAKVAGYSKGTLYAHWPARTDLIVDAFISFIDVPHHTPTGDLRTDLVEELISFRTAMVEHRLDRVLAVLVALTASVSELVDVRDRLALEGERIVRSLLEPLVSDDELDAATLMLCGAILHSALMHGHPPDVKVIETSVDLTLRAIGRTEVPHRS